MAPARKRTVATISWCSVLALVLLKTASDTAGLLIGGNRAYAADSYNLLRELPGGMRVYGLILGALFVATIFCLGQRQADALRWCLALLAGWYVGWLLAIAGAWWALHAPMAWGAVGSLVAISAMAVLVARATPTRGR